MLLIDEITAINNYFVEQISIAQNQTIKLTPEIICNIKLNSSRKWKQLSYEEKLEYLHKREL